MTSTCSELRDDQQVKDSIFSDTVLRVKFEIKVILEAFKSFENMYSYIKFKH